MVFMLQLINLFYVMLICIIEKFFEFLGSYHVILNQAAAQEDSDGEDTLFSK